MTLLHCRNEFIQVDLAGSSPDCAFRNRRISQSDIRCHVTREESGLLGHDGEIGTQFCRTDLPDVHIVEQYLATLDFIEPEQQIGNSSFTCSRTADKGDLFPWFYRE